MAAAKKRNTPETFRPGQRVRGKYDPYQDLVGTILSERRWFNWGDEYGWGYEITIDGQGAFDPKGKRYAAVEGTFVPLYDGDQVVSWSECAWRPRAVHHG